MSVGELKDWLNEYPEDYEVVMNIRHKYDISKEEGERGWMAYINGIRCDNDWQEVRLMN